MKKFLSNNALSLCFLLMFLASIVGQIYCGRKEYNKELIEQNQPTVPFSSYLTSGHFVQSTFENWESEFLQMALFVVLTIFLQQRGSSESKDFDKVEEVDRAPDPNKKDAPWPVRAGGLMLQLYKHSLTIVLLLLFAFSFVAHFCGSLADENTQLAIKGEPLTNASSFFWDSRFWFESLQN